jgi:subtilisin family serine protease
MSKRTCSGAMAGKCPATTVPPSVRCWSRLRPSLTVALYVADIYCGDPSAAAVKRLAAALAWLMQERVPVINLSVVGPPNLLLERLVAAATRKGHLLVAAVGNDGPAAAPLYPAAYPGVVSVTAVDRKLKVIVEAGRGSSVDFAAPGAGVAAASLPAGTRIVRGTSFAAPVVAGLLAQRHLRPDPVAASQALQSLAAAAMDLGKPGFDPAYGNGCVACVSSAFDVLAGEARP